MRFAFLKGHADCHYSCLTRLVSDVTMSTYFSNRSCCHYGSCSGRPGCLKQAPKMFLSHQSDPIVVNVIDTVCNGMLSDSRHWRTNAATAFRMRKLFSYLKDHCLCKYAHLWKQIYSFDFS